MKRIIKYHNVYSDGANFSTCGTKYEILPGLYPDDAGLDVLRSKAKELNLKTAGPMKNLEKSNSSRELNITHSLKLAQKAVKEKNTWDKAKKYDQFLGFVQLPQTDLPALKTINNKTPKGLLYDLVNGGSADRLGIDEYGENSDGEQWLIMSGWHFYHIIPLLGYSMDKFLKQEKIDDTYFYDSVERCSECNVYDHRDDGYNYNHRQTDEGSIGINCGCYDDYCENNIEEFENDSDHAMELSVAEKLEKSGKLKHLERFIGGMTDGRGGSYGGKSTREGDPAGVLAEYEEKMPGKKFVFTHDESGQFQQYFSIWQVTGKSKSKSKHLKAV